MKIRLFILVGLIFTTNGFGQTYHPLPIDSVYWVEYSSGPYQGSSTCIQEVYTLVYPTPNTVVYGGHEYTEFRTTVRWEFFPLQPWGCPAPFTVSDMVYAYMRNDTLNRKIYLYNANNPNPEILLYDFDVNMGDTIYPSNADGYQCNTDTFTVLNIDSIDINGEYRRRIATQDYYYSDTLYMIEGIGSTKGLAYNNYCPFEYNTALVCYQYKNLEFGSMGNSHCTRSLGINSPLASTQFIHPISNGQYFIDPSNGHLQITCYDVLGKFSSERDFKEPGYIDFSELSSGVYIMYVQYNGQPLKPYKFIVNH